MTDRVCHYCGNPIDGNPRKKFCEVKCRVAFYKKKRKGINREIHVQGGTAIILPAPTLPPSKKRYADMTIEEVLEYVISIPELPNSIKDTLVKAKLAGLFQQAQTRELPPELELKETDADRQLLESPEALEFAEWIVTQKEKDRLRKS